MTIIKQGRDILGRFAVTGSKRDCLGLTWFDMVKYHTRRVTRASIIVCAVISMAGWTFVAGTYVAPVKEVVANTEVIKEVKGKTAVMERIAKCESGNSHTDPKTGQVYMLANTNKTVDVGKYMINSVWHKKAKELGYDITKEVDNEKMAYWIYENMGTEAWKYSLHCWNK